jgi:hypothetical protein
VGIAAQHLHSRRAHRKEPCPLHFGEKNVSPRISLFLLLFVLGSVSPLLSVGSQSWKNSLPQKQKAGNFVRLPANTPGEREGLFPYRFDRRANALVSIVFPSTVYPSGYAKAYLDRARSMEFASRDEALAYHAASINAGSGVAEPYEKAKEATESFWMTAHPLNGRAQRLSEALGRIELLINGMVKDKSKPTNLLEKALWHRDVVCSLQAILHCQAVEQDTFRKARWDRTKDALLECLEQVVFTGAEYDQLKAQLPIVPSPTHFVSRCRYLLTDDYLPPVVLTRSANWHELPSDEAPGLHFQAYGGRSFVRVFIMAPGMSEPEFFGYWTKVTRKFGMGVTVSAAVPSLPAGTQTVLLRTFGLFLNDGSYADSGIPEEVLVRVFKYTGATLDPQTSDGLGTLHYQYKLRRDRLLNEPATLGLCRIQDADGQFYGFFAEVPEPESTGHLTTMRANCIACHSELLYGASTVFSLCRHSPAKPKPSLTEAGLMERMGPKGWLMKQESLQTIQKEMISRLQVANGS